MKARIFCEAYLAPLRGAVNLRHVPVVCASLRPPATFVLTLRVDGGSIVTSDGRSALRSELLERRE